MIVEPLASDKNPLRCAIDDVWLADETRVVNQLLKQTQLADDARQRIDSCARELVIAVREKTQAQGSIDAFIQEYDLSSQEGVVLMCLAEALLRIPDDETADRLIQDKLGNADWGSHLWHSSSMFVNASTWGLMLTGRIVSLENETLSDGRHFLQRLVSKSGEAVIRLAIRQAMRIMGQQFVMGAMIDAALARSRESGNIDYRYSYDMLGEAALTRADAEGYFAAYQHAIQMIANEVSNTISGAQTLYERASISIKLSALHPRYEPLQRAQVLAQLTPRLLTLAQQASAAGITLTIDAEEADRLMLSLDLFEAVYRDSSLAQWDGFGLAVQAYQKRAPMVIDWLQGLSDEVGRKIPVRLVKGAYWDTEIKRAQERGLDGYPVYTRKIASDVAYLACAQKLLAAGDAFYPQFATHNAHTVAAIIEFAGDKPFEFQRLHGMGEALYSEVINKSQLSCRVYAPVGNYQSLLPYLVRRLLENGANTSFVNRITDHDAAIEEIVSDPVLELDASDQKPHPHIPLPKEIYGEARRNSSGLNLYSDTITQSFARELNAFITPDGRVNDSDRWQAASIINGKEMIKSRERVALFSPANQHHATGVAFNADELITAEALASAADAAQGWAATSANARATILDNAAQLLEDNRAELIALCVREAGKTVIDSLGEVREAVDFCRYYAFMLRENFVDPELMHGPTGEHNEISLHGRGVFVCISPWNFPLAIFVGQVTAALAAGNCVIAKPAAQTPLIAARAVQLLHQAGVPGEVLHLLIGSGRTIGMQLVNDRRTSGIAFTGSTETAQTINRALASREGAIVPLIAETGGQNCMIVDSSALPEQVVIDVIQSAFNSAGQRCSALRVLFLQDDVADQIIEQLSGAMAELVIGDPLLLSTDVGPVIDHASREVLQAHADQMKTSGKLLYQCPLPEGLKEGFYFPPHLFEIAGIELLEREVFGPVLHVVRFPANGLDDVIQSINATRYGLTLGVHSRIEATARYIRQQIRVGNLYINRNMIGATVGVQPFGGEGLSGTGPKAGGPHYLHRFATERTLTVNTSAIGGNATLLSLGEE
ncbi:MAG: bifunctional proline dehydrogenase/L-glutamate gamma-semialdehyde dehydrogenase PutA [Gammaproteobacteria bacterium]|nr:bifunctional proline dehydrogenase/L-glutamate gamma-semialdehyde dehydrogenase PutA [Gammaproteobacteria bacterium]